MNTASSRKRASRAGESGTSRRRPSRAEAEAAIRTLILWAGDDPSREGLRGTPGRVARSYEEFFAGYGSDPIELLQRTFEETDGIFTEPAGLVESRSWKEKNSVPERSTICCTGE